MQRLVLGTAFVVVLGLIALLLAFALGVLPVGASADSDEVSLEAATRAELKLSKVTSGEEAVLTAAELTSLFRYRPEVWVLGPVHSPVVAMAGDSLQLSGKIAKEEIPAEIEIGPLRALLPDTAGIEISGTVRSAGEGQIVLAIGTVEVAGMPIPDRYYTKFLQTDALTLPLPVGISAARVEGGVLILTP